MCIRDRYVNWSASDFTMDGSLRSLLYSTMCPPTSANTAYFNDADFDKDMDEGLATANEEEQAKYYSDAQKIAWEACPWLFLGNDQIIYSTCLLYTSIKSACKILLVLGKII